MPKVKRSAIEEIAHLATTSIDGGRDYARQVRGYLGHFVSDVDIAALLRSERAGPLRLAERLRAIEQERETLLENLKTVLVADPALELPSAFGKDPTASQLSWEPLPPGWWVSSRSVSLASTKSIQQFIDADARFERLKFLMSLTPKEFYSGSRMATRVYHVAVFRHIAIADSIDFGNALYWVPSKRDEWKRVFRLSKKEAIASGARRIVHSGDWQGRVRVVLDRAI